MKGICPVCGKEYEYTRKNPFYCMDCLKAKNKEDKKRIDTFDFGEAIRVLKSGKPVSRLGWNGKKMFLVLSEGYKGNGTNLRNPHARLRFRFEEVYIASHIDMIDANGRYIIGWLASQTDMLSEDWFIVQDVEAFSIY